MTNPFHLVKTRASFFAVLDTAIGPTQELLARDPKFALCDAIANQLSLYFKHWRSDPGLVSFDSSGWRTSVPEDCDQSEQ